MEIQASLKLIICQPLMVQEYDVAWVEVTSPSGEFLLLPGHIPLISMISDGESIRYQTTAGEIKTCDVKNCILQLEKKGAIQLIC